MRAPASVSRASLPDRDALDAVRHIGRRFPKARVREVPLLRAAELDLRADPTGGTRVWLALEALQVTGSFHVRGALVALAAIAARGGRRPVVAASVGNFGVAVAYAASMLDLDATVVVPRTVARIKREKMERYGATVTLAPTDRYDGTRSCAADLAGTMGADLVTPDGDEQAVLGSGGSLGFEIVRGLGGVPERVLAPVGSGALSTGLAWALAAEAAASADRCVWGVESDSVGAMSAVLDPSVARTRATTARSGAHGVAGQARDVTGAPGANGVARMSESNGLQRSFESNGLQGTSESNGLQGTSGSNGLQGTSGSNALQGTSESNGVHGTSESSGPARASESNGVAGTSDTWAAASLADELTGTITAEGADRARAAMAGVIAVRESQIAAAMTHAYQDMGLILEGTAALALAPVLFGLPEPVRGGDLVVVLTGRNVDPERLEAVVGSPSGGDLICPESR